MTVNNKFSIRIYILLLFLIAFQVSGHTQNQKSKKKVKKTEAEKDSLKAIRKIKLRNAVIDSTDNALDISGYLTNLKGFLPVPIVITDPALKYGGGAIGIFIHEQKNTKPTEELDPLPPRATFLGGFGTGNKSYGFLLGHKGSELNDVLRYSGFVSYMDIKMNFYSFEGITFDEPINLNIRSIPINLDLSVQLPKTKIYVGFNYKFFFNNVDVGGIPPDIAELIGGTSENELLSGLGYNLLVDYRDNIISPQKGFYYEGRGTFYDKKLASSYNFFRFKNAISGFIPIKNKVFIGMKADMRNALKETPIYMRPFIELRGMPIFRFQADNVITYDLELRYNVYKRWSLTGFVGAGNAFDDFKKVQLKETKVSGGLGFRYLLSRYFNLQTGMDFARGPENWTFHIIVGYYWGAGL